MSCKESEMSSSQNGTQKTGSRESLNNEQRQWSDPCHSTFPFVMDATMMTFLDDDTSLFPSKFLLQYSLDRWWISRSVVLYWRYVVTSTWLSGRSRTLWTRISRLCWRRSWRRRSRPASGRARPRRSAPSPHTPLATPAPRSTAFRHIQWEYPIHQPVPKDIM